MGAPGRPIPSKRATHQHSSCTPVQYLGNASQIQSPHHRRRPPRSTEGDATRRPAHCGWAGPRFRSGGRRAPRNRRATRRRHPAFLCSIPGRARFQADFMRLADRCFGPCGTAARRLPGTPVGDTPICVGFQGCAAEKVGSGRRDLVKPLCHLSDFRVSGNSTSSLWQTQLSIAGGLVMKQEMNEYFTFDRR